MVPLLSKEGVGVVRCSTHHPYPSSIEEGSYLHSRLYAQKVRRTTARRGVAIGTRLARGEALRSVGVWLALPS